MASWGEVQAAASDLVSFVEAAFAAGRHKTMATLRADGSPRISGTEVQLIGGEMWLGSMPSSRKVGDLRRDPRVAIHSLSPDPNPLDHTDWAGDAKVAGVAVEVTDVDTRQWYLEALRELMSGLDDQEQSGAPAEADEASDGEEEQGFEFVLFRIELAEVVATRIGEPADHLVIDMWHEGRGVSSSRR